MQSFAYSGATMWAVGLLLVLLCHVGGVPVSLRDHGKPTLGCGYNSCPAIDPDVQINVHIVPHSHDDVGWLKNVDEYYYGANNSIHRAQVQAILDSVVRELHLDPQKRFIQVESAFFWRWWSEQEEETKKIVKQLVEQGRLEFVGGGWSMNDEAVTHYSAIVDNMALGFKMLNDEFGECARARVAWQIDPFGHSKEQAKLFAQMGFHGMFFARIDYRDKEQRKKNKTLHMIWNGASGPATEDDSIFTGVFSDHYSSPWGFCFDLTCTDNPMVTEVDSMEYNVDSKVKRFQEFVIKETSYYDGPSKKHIMVTMGDDFHYMNAAQNYKNLDLLIKLVNERTQTPSIRLFYSTPSCFLKAINDDMKDDYEFPIKEDDFFPYATGAHSYWTGYYTSRPSSKLNERKSNAVLQAAKQMEVLLAKSDFSSHLDVLRRAVAIMQHHDAVSGTEREAVAYDYGLRMSEGTQAAERMMGPTIMDYLGDIPVLLNQTEYLCPLTNMSQCNITSENKKFILIVYNSLSQTADTWVRFPLAKNVTDIHIYAEDGEEIEVSILETHPLVKALPGRIDNSDADAVLHVVGLPPLGFRSFFVTYDFGGEPRMSRVNSNTRTSGAEDDLTISINAYLYTSSTLGQASGAYVFRPSTQHSKIKLKLKNITYLESDLVNETWVELMDESEPSDFVSYVIRRYLGQQHLEIEWLVGPIPDCEGREVVMEYSKNKLEKNVDREIEFWTDANGRQYMRRVKDSRFSFNFTTTDANKEPESSNYYPITTGIYINILNSEETLSVLTDRSQGGTSLRTGAIELMVHRQTLKDDGFGLGEALHEKEFGTGLTARGKHLVMIEPSATAAKWRRLKSLELYMQPQVMFSPINLNLEDWNAVPKWRKVFSGLNMGYLPSNVHIMTLENWSPTPRSEDSKLVKVLLRLEHIFDKGEDKELSKPAKVSLSENFFSKFSIKQVTETSLGGNIEKKDLEERLKWSNEAKHQAPKQPISAKIFNGREVNIELEPMQIRTFILCVEMKT